MNLLNALLKNTYARHKRYLKKHSQHAHSAAHPGESYSVHAMESWQTLHWHETQAAHFGSLFRGGVLVSYFLGFLAVVFAVIPISGLLSEEMLHHVGFIFVVLELIAILLIVLIYLSGKENKRKKPRWFLFHNWRGQWQTERTCCEVLRYKEIIIWLKLDSVINKYAVPAEILSTPEMSAKDLFHHLQQQIAEQLAYNKNTAAENYFIKHRLHSIAKWSFILTLVSCLAHFFVHSALLSALSAILPALGSCCHGIASTAEYEKIGQQSELTFLQLSRLQEQLNEDQEIWLTNPSRLRQLAEDFLNVVFDDRDKWYLFTSSSSLPLG